MVKKIRVEYEETVVRGIGLRIFRTYQIQKIGKRKLNLATTDRIEEDIWRATRRAGFGASKGYILTHLKDIWEDRDLAAQNGQQEEVSDDDDYPDSYDPTSENTILEGVQQRDYLQDPVPEEELPEFETVDLTGQDSDLE